MSYVLCARDFTLGTELCSTTLKDLTIISDYAINAPWPGPRSRQMTSGKVEAVKKSRSQHLYKGWGMIIKAKDGLDHRGAG